MEKQVIEAGWKRTEFLKTHNNGRKTRFAIYFWQLWDEKHCQGWPITPGREGHFERNMKSSRVGRHMSNRIYKSWNHIYFHCLVELARPELSNLLDPSEINFDRDRDRVWTRHKSQSRFFNFSAEHWYCNHLCKSKHKMNKMNRGRFQKAAKGQTWS